MLGAVSIDWSETLAFGDDMNDACLFEKAGVAVAMAKAPPELVKISTYQIGENRQLQSLAAVLRARID